MKHFLALDGRGLSLELKKLKIGLERGKNFQHQWVPETERHIVLLGLKDLGPDEVEELSLKLDPFLLGKRPFDLRLEGVQAYPKIEEARLLWIGVQNSKELRSLREELQGALVNFLTPSFEEEFRPIFPIVRLRNHRNVTDLISPFKNTDFGNITVNRLVLFEMTSGGAFPTYRPLREFGPAR